MACFLYLISPISLRVDVLDTGAGRLRSVVLHGLADDYFDTYVQNIQGVDLAAVSRAAKEHVHPDRVAIVVVGDASGIESQLEELKLGPVIKLDLDGTPKLAAK